MSQPLTGIMCRGCNATYVEMARESCGVVSPLCRRCRMVSFGEAVERLMSLGPGHFGLSDTDVSAYALQFFAAVDELYELSMAKEAR